jgi:hypothetical protein
MNAGALSPTFVKVVVSCCPNAIRVVNNVIVK